MMTDDLVKRLRVPCFEKGLDEGWIDHERKEAADRIEELEAKLAKTVEVVDPDKREAAETIRQQAAEIDQCEKALKAAYYWLVRWGDHVGNCEGGLKCTCGLTSVRFDASVALEDKGG